MGEIEFAEESECLAKKYLSEELVAKLAGQETERGFSLEQAVKSGLENPDSSIGVYAGDEETYSLFSEFFEQVIADYHSLSSEPNHKTDLDLAKLSDYSLTEKEQSFIKSTRVRVARNVEGFALPPLISKERRLELEERLKEVFANLDGDLAGEYLALEDMSEKQRQKLVNQHYLFKKGDRFLEAAGINRDWPSGRGIFLNEDKTFLVWANEEDHLRIISMEEGGDLKAVFKRLVNGIKAIKDELNFIKSDYLGAITSCPSNLGTGMRASVHIDLANLDGNKAELEELASKHHLQLRGLHGEHSEDDSSIYDISNKRRLGISEVEAIKDLYVGLKEIIAAEKELS